MRIGYIILCRFNSSRLPGKILRQVGGKPLLKTLLERLEPLDLKNVVVATSEEATDNAIADYCIDNNIQLFRGSLHDVAGRFLAAAKHYGFDYAVRINGDNLFADAQLIKNIAEVAVFENLDFVSNVPQRTFPTGMSVEVVRVDMYEGLYKIFNASEKYNEHVTLYLYDNPELCKKSRFITNTEFPESHGVKMAIDTETDMEMAAEIVNRLGNSCQTAGWREIVQLKLQMNDELGRN